MIRVVKGPHRICQGDIFKDIEYIEYAVEKSGIIEISKIIFPLVIILSQDCDLEENYRMQYSKNRGTNQDKWLVSILVAPLYNVEHVFQGVHLSDLNLRMQQINKGKRDGTYLTQNRIPRFHYLDFPQNIPIVNSVIDFKHYFSVNSKYLQKLKSKNFICSVKPLYREQISQRFSNYLSRIGLPEPTNP